MSFRRCCFWSLCVFSAVRWCVAFWNVNRNVYCLTPCGSMCCWWIQWIQSYCVVLPCSASHVVLSLSLRFLGCPISSFVVWVVFLFLCNFAFVLSGAACPLILSGRSSVFRVCLDGLILSCLVLSNLVLPCLVLSCFALSCLVSCLVLSCLVSCLVLSCLILSCLVLLCLVLELLWLSYDI